MDNWLLIIVATVFLICIAVGYIRGFLKFGLSLISTVLTLVIVAFLSPYVADALAKYTPVDDFIEQKFVAAFMPELSEEQLAGLDEAAFLIQALFNDTLHTGAHFHRTGTRGLRLEFRGPGSVLRLYRENPHGQGRRSLLFLGIVAKAETGRQRQAAHKNEGSKQRMSFSNHVFSPQTGRHASMKGWLQSINIKRRRPSRKPAIRARKRSFSKK